MLPSAPLAPTERVMAYWRLLHPVPSLLTVLAAGAFVLLAARGLPPLSRLLHLLFIEAGMQFSISAFNDYFDRKVDVGRPDKPVAVGVISPRVAWTTGLLFAAIAVLLAAPLGFWLTLFTIVGLGGGLLYDAGLKNTPFSWLPFAIAFPTLPLWAWAGRPLIPRAASSDGPFKSRRPIVVTTFKSSIPPVVPNHWGSTPFAGRGRPPTGASS